MSSEARPITPRRFAAALRDLSLPLLHLKVLEIRNQMAHLDYSNQQLKPFAEGTVAGADGTTTQTEPDQDCADAIRENEQVLERMEERIRLIRAEVEGRGASWTEFQSKEEADEMARRGREMGQLNGHLEGDEDVPAESAGASGERTHPAWSDGTFQAGTTRNGELQMDQHAGGRLTDEELRRQMEERMREMEVDDEEDEGMHL